MFARSLAAALVVAVALPRAAYTQQPAQSPPADSAPPAAQPRARAWYERLTLRGYTQVRYNRLLESNPELVCAQCDRSIGNNGGFSIRRARLVLSGDIGDRLSVYIQPDFAAEVSGTQHLVQLRDLYADLWLQRSRALRLRIGQSKVPFGFENLQSSSNRIPLDRADALNSGVPNERDIGAFLYWTPAAVRERFRLLTESGLKGSGDYGVFGAGMYNGQTVNRPELNNSLHGVARLTYPFLFGSQFVEMGVQGYSGRFVIPASQRTVGVTGPLEFADWRAAASLVVYPQPFGFQAEWNIGEGPESDPAEAAIRLRQLDGGYLQAMYRARFSGQQIIPFVRVQRYDGGKKQETDARQYRVRELEAGAEWLPFAALEITANFTFSDRRFEDAARPDNRQRGRLLRVQAQMNY